MRRTQRRGCIIIVAVLLLSAGCAARSRPRDSALPSIRLAFDAPAARSVAIAGSFNRWDPARHPLSGPDRTGRWTATLRLPPGRYEYLFVIDGSEWVLDPEAPAVDNGLGGRNSIMVLSGGE